MKPYHVTASNVYLLVLSIWLGFTGIPTPPPQFLMDFYGKKKMQEISETVSENTAWS